MSHISNKYLNQKLILELKKKKHLKKSNNYSNLSVIVELTKIKISFFFFAKVTFT